VFVSRLIVFGVLMAILTALYAVSFGLEYALRKKELLNEFTEKA
jgi:hypothetical protein